MALHKDFPDSPHAILDPAVRWFPADEALRETSAEGGNGVRASVVSSDRQTNARIAICLSGLSREAS